MRLHKPLTYQEIGGKRREVEGRYLLHPPKEQAPKAQVGFHVAAYDTSRPLVIDPVLAYSTFLGGSKFDVATSIAVDSAKNVYVTGRTTSPDFPDLNGYDTSFNSPGSAPDVFITKLNASGSARVYSTYLGGTGQDQGLDIGVDTAGNAYVTGVTFSLNFPLQAAYDSSRSGDRDCFVTKLNTSGSSLVYSTYLGGSGLEYCYGIAVNSAQHPHVTGSTNSSGALGSTPFPTTSGAYDTTYNSTTPAGDTFITKFSAAGSALVYSTFLGGKDGDSGRGIVVDNAGNAYVTGETISNNFPTTPGASDTQLNDGAGTEPDAFVTKLNASASQLVYSTFLGGRGHDYGTGIALGAAGDAYVTGHTHINTVPNNFPTTAGAFDESPNGQDDGFVTRLKADGSGRVYSTYLGGTSADCGAISNSTGCHIAVDSFDNAYVTGPTMSNNFPTTAGAYDTGFNTGGSDSFVTKLNATGTKPLLYSTFLGSSGTDLGHGIALDSSRNVYVTGETNNGFSTPHFPTSSGGYDTTYNGLGDAFVAKLTGADVQVSKTDSPDPVTVNTTLTYTITVKNNGPLGATGVQLTDSLPSSATFVSVTPSTCTRSGTTVTCPIGSLAKAGIKTITIKVKPTAKGGISNKATVKGNELDPNTTNDTLTVTTTVN